VAVLRLSVVRRLALTGDRLRVRRLLPGVACAGDFAHGGRSVPPGPPPLDLGDGAFVVPVVLAARRGPKEPLLGEGPAGVAAGFPAGLDIALGAPSPRRRPRTQGHARIRRLHTALPLQLDAADRRHPALAESRPSRPPRVSDVDRMASRQRRHRLEHGTRPAVHSRRRPPRRPHPGIGLSLVKQQIRPLRKKI